MEGMTAIAAPVIAPHDPEQIVIQDKFQRPTAAHLLGTDENGRDILARLLDGGHVSLIVGLIAVVIADTVGVLFGAFAGYFGKAIDSILMRITDALLAIPSFFLLLVVLFRRGRGMSYFMLALFLIALAIALWYTGIRTPPTGL